MPNGTLKLYNKLNNSLLVSLDILGTFNIEDNLNETPSNMKVKVITSNTYREEFQVNTVAYHEDTNSWWVIKSDESTYLMTGEYEHEIQLVEYLEFYAYRHLPNCAFAPNTYTLEQMLLRLFNIAKLSITMNYPNFLDQSKIMPFFSFENFTVANAIKNIGRAINAIPKMSIGFPFNYALFTGTISFSSSPPFSGVLNGDYWYKTDTNQLYQRISGSWVFVTSTNGTTSPTIADEPNLRFVNTATQQLFISQDSLPILTFINRNGNDNTIVNVLNTQFPIAYEKNMNSSDQFTTRSVSNITNAKSSSLIISPQEGGYKNIVPNSLTFENSNREQARVILPSKIDKIDFVNVVVPISLYYTDGDGSVNGVYNLIHRGYYTDKEVFKTKLEQSGYFGTGQIFTNEQLLSAINKLPEPSNFYKVIYNQEIDKTFRAINTTTSISLFHKKMSLLNKFEFDTVSKIVSGVNVIDTDKKDRTIHWLPNTNEIVMPLSFRNGLATNDDHNMEYYLLGDDGAGVNAIIMVTDPFEFNITNKQQVFNEDVYIQVGYYPIADIKVSIDNDNDAQDEKFFNQSGKVIDAVSVSKLITSHTNDSVEGTKIRNAKYESLANILILGQLVRDNNQIYIVTQRSIDGHIKNGNEYYNVIYTLSRNRVARSENIVADSAVISYKTPDDNLVFRNQLYKDYIELSLANITPKDTPYLSMSEALVLSDTLAGTNFDYTVLAKSGYGDLVTLPDFTIEPSTMLYYVKNPTVFNLHKAKLINVNWQDNNVLGFRLNRTSGNFDLGGTLIQTPIVYTDNLGKATNFELLFLDTNNLETAKNSFNTSFSSKADDLIPFRDLTRVDFDYYKTSVIANNRFLIRLRETNYAKDPFEIPVFEYMIQANDDYNTLGNIVIGSDLFTTFTGNIRYHYIINNTTRFSAENANRLYNANAPTGLTNRRVGFSRPSGVDGTQIQMILYNAFDPNASPFPILTQNTSDISNVGVYAVQGGTGVVKFLFAINDYNMTSKSLFNIYINNWKI